MPYNSLRPVREKKGITLAQLAGKTSISIRTLQSYEAGERTIAADDLRKLSRVLYVSPAEILEPSDPPPPPPPPPSLISPPTVARPAEKMVQTNVVTTTPEAEIIQRPPPRPARDLPHRAPINGPRPSAPARPVPPRSNQDVRAARPAQEASPGQLDQIHSLARRMGLDESALLERTGVPLKNLDHLAARAAIARLRAEMEESGKWQPRVAEGPDREGEYLAKVREQGIPIDIHLIDGQQFQGTIQDYTPYVIQLRDSATGSDVTIRKLAIAYYQTRGQVDDTE